MGGFEASTRTCDPVGGVVVTAVVHGAGGSLLQEFLDDEGLEREVVHSQGACGPCRANRNPDLIPFPGCNGNIAAKDPDDAKALAIGNLCNCKVMFVDKEHHK